MATILTQVRASTLENVTLTTNLVLGPAKIDGVSIVSGNRILVKAQTNKIQNGIYTISAAGAWVRATDFALSSSQTGGTIVFVQEGDTLADTGWVISSDGTIIVGTDQILFEKFSINLKLAGESVPSSMVLRAEKGYPLTIQELDNNFKYLSVTLTQKLNTVDFTSIAVRDKINLLTAGDANLNAWKLNGYLPSEASSASTIVARDADSGITSEAFHGNLDGNASTATLADYSTLANNVDGVVAVSNGGTGATTAAGARTNLVAVCSTGDTMSGKLIFAAANASRASLNITPKVDSITSPVNGDVWTDSNNVFYRLNSVTQTVAPLDSPVFVGAPTAPTATNDSNSTAVATTAFVKNIKVLTDAALALKAPLASPTFTGTPLSVTPATTDNSTKIATTAYAVSKIAYVIADYSTTVNMNSAIATALTSYSTTTGMNSAIATALTSYTTTTAMNVIFNNYYTKTQTDTAVSNAVSVKAATTYVNDLQDKWGTSKKYVQSTAPSAPSEGDFWFKV
jgi:hypothetical protein